MSVEKTRAINSCIYCMCMYYIPAIGTVSDMDHLQAYLIGIIIVGCLFIAMVLIILCLCCAIFMRKRLKPPTTVQRNSRGGPQVGFPNLYDQPWRLIGRIGQGRYGYVYKAQYQDDIVAIKIFSHNCRNAWETECTLNSMESTAHKNIVEFVTSESRGSGISLQLFIITRYYPLGSLNQFLRQHVITLEQARVMIDSVACGLAHLHSEYYTNSSGIMTEKYAIAHR